MKRIGRGLGQSIASIGGILFVIGVWLNDLSQNDTHE